jgi:hypothetical protein
MAPGEQCDDGNRLDGDACGADCALPPPPEAPRASPWPLVTGGAGALLFAAGATSTTLGLVPWWSHESARADIAAAEERIDRDPGAALADARAAQMRQAQASADWGAWGLPLVVTGAVVAGVGTVGAGAAAWLWLAEGE